MHAIIAVYINANEEWEYTVRIPGKPDAILACQDAIFASQNAAEQYAIAQNVDTWSWKLGSF